MGPGWIIDKNVIFKFDSTGAKLRSINVRVLTAKPNGRLEHEGSDDGVATAIALRALSPADGDRHPDHFGTCRQRRSARRTSSVTRGAC